MRDGPSALRGLKVLEVANLYAGPLCGTILADFGADVVKVEDPHGDPIRDHGAQKNGVGLWWKVLGRNKRCATLKLSVPTGQKLFRELASDADVVIESFRPGVMERWGLGFDVLSSLNPKLSMVRVTGFGQRGPYSARPGFGTLAEAMSGWAHMNGHPDGPPTLPPFGMADGIAGLSAATATLLATNEAGRTGQGQEVDIAIIEPIMSLLGPQPTVLQQTGLVPERVGNISRNTAPRNVYRTRDDRWVAVASSTNSTATRLMTLVGREDLTKEPWFGTGRGRFEHLDLIDPVVAAWIAERDADEVVSQFERVGAATALVATAADVVENPQYQALASFVELDDPDLGTLLMQNALFRMSRTPGAVAFAGRALGADNTEVFAELGLDEDAISGLKTDGVI